MVDLDTISYLSALEHAALVPSRPTFDFAYPTGTYATYPVQAPVPAAAPVRVFGAGHTANVAGSSSTHANTNAGPEVHARSSNAQFFGAGLEYGMPTSMPGVSTPGYTAMSGHGIHMHPSAVACLDPALTYYSYPLQFGDSMSLDFLPEDLGKYEM